MKTNFDESKKTNEKFNKTNGLSSLKESWNI